MNDDIVAGGILPIDDKTADDEFDLDAVDSDAFLPDEEDDPLVDAAALEVALEDNEILGITDE